MKKILLFLIVFGVATKWDSITSFLDAKGQNNTYTLGSYVSDEWYSDHEGYNEALKVSDENNVPAIIYLYTDWCKYCAKFKKELLSDNDVKESLSQFVKIKINPEHSEYEQAIKEKIGGKGYPSLFIQLGSKAKPVRFKGPFFKNNNRWELMSSDEFVSKLSEYRL